MPGAFCRLHEKEGKTSKTSTGLRRTPQEKDQEKSETLLIKNDPWCQEGRQQDAKKHHADKLTDYVGQMPSPEFCLEGRISGGAPGNILMLRLLQGSLLHFALGCWD